MRYAYNKHAVAGVVVEVETFISRGGLISMGALVALTIQISTK